MKSFLLFFFLSAALLSAQSDWVKWESQQVSYELPAYQHHDYSIDKSNFGLSILSVARNTYYFFVSDLDGDNCAFSPSCSAFYLQAIKETSIFKGTLMFADRFTRDINFFKGSNHYQLLPIKKYLDPVYNYTLHSAKIKL
ncbi:MAG: membrane protein insertion efficiency factor YidD [Ignavibacteriales bacterium]|nr:membrane protein insertion efficiency factor YidD [Ignavibacteriales bacterium]